jgi:glucose/arabinose dehydrogenase
VGDVGARAREEVNRVQRGGNYGWRCYEGTQQTTLTCGSPSTPLQAPVAEYERSAGQSVIAGFVYHGAAFPGMVGHFVFADYNLQRIWHIPATTAPTRMVTASEGWISNINPASFAQDRDGELLLVDVRTSSLYKLVPAP